MKVPSISVAISFCTATPLQFLHPDGDISQYTACIETANHILHFVFNTYRNYPMLICPVFPQDRKNI